MDEWWTMQAEAFFGDGWNLENKWRNRGTLIVLNQQWCQDEHGCCKQQSSHMWLELPDDGFSCVLTLHVLPSKLSWGCANVDTDKTPRKNNLLFLLLARRLLVRLHCVQKAEMSCRKLRLRRKNVVPRKESHCLDSAREEWWHGSFQESVENEDNEMFVSTNEMASAESITKTTETHAKVTPACQNPKLGKQLGVPRMQKSNSQKQKTGKLMSSAIRWAKSSPTLTLHSTLSPALSHHCHQLWKLLALAPTESSSPHSVLPSSVSSPKVLPVDVASPQEKSKSRH